MRADRLVAVLLMLQARTRVTAAEVAAELEVSERTARRDLEALAMAGVPVYSQQGRGGGWSLVGGARTDLSGLTEPEARALFLVAGPAAGATPEVRAALRKLVRALPETLRADAEAAAGAVHVDPVGWGTRPPPPPPPHLDALQRAVVRAEQVVLGYAGRERTSERTIHPLGLVAKGPTWYLVAQTDAGQRTFRVDRVTSVAPTGEPVVRPEGFDLSTAWASISETVGGLIAPARVEAHVDADGVGLLRMMFGPRLSLGGPGPDGRVAVELAGASPEIVAAEIAGLGRRIEVIAPPSARAHLARLAGELAAVYGAEATG